MAETTPRLAISQHKDISVVEFKESKILDEMNINEIGNTLAGLVDTSERPKVLIDFTSVDHLSSAALGMLININNKIRDKSGQLRLCKIRPQILEVFVITKLNRLFKICDKRDEAIKSFE